MLLAVLSAAVLSVGVALLAVSGPPATSTGAGPTAPPRTTAGSAVTTHARDQAFGAALSFLQRYEQPGGRVVRWDQGADTVSEGEAYAMLLSAAAGDRERFDAAWSWTRSHLLLPSGLLAWHWAGGRVTGTEPAADADVDAAYALELAASRFGERTDRGAAAAMASAVVGDESVVGASGRVLVAGPWAVGPPAYANPSYAAPAELADLGRLTTDGPEFTALAAGTRDLVGRVMAADPLPPDWVQLNAGRPLAIAPSGQEASDGYGFDAVRLPIRWAASCDAADRRVAAELWPALGRAALAGRATVDLSLSGRSGPGALRSPVGMVAAAAAGWAAGHRSDARLLLSRAEAANQAHPTYYSSAWVALGRMLLETKRLGTCGAA